MKFTLPAWVESQTVWAAALKDYRGNIVPTTNVGTGPEGTESVNGWEQFMSIMAVKAARDLSLDMSVPAGNSGP